MALPSFEKVLRETDIREMLVIPTHFMQHLPAVEGGRSEELTVNASGTQRIFGYYTRDGANRRPVLRSGWRSYVREKGYKSVTRSYFSVWRGSHNTRFVLKRKSFS